MENDVFISHAHKDKSIADSICGKLECSHLKCWTSARGISAREDWTEATRKAIGFSRVIVLVLSENANAAPHIKRELAHASYMRCIIITFRLAETLPRREILFYLGNVPWFNSLNPPTEEHLEAFTARIKGLMAGSAGAGNATLAQSERKKTTSLIPTNAWFGALRASHYRTLGILKWIAYTTFLCAVVLFLWFALRQTKEWASLPESHRRSMDRTFSLSPTPSPQASGDALESKQTSTFTRFGLWQAANGSPTPLVQGPQDSPLNTPAERSADATSSPQRDATPGERAGGLASEPRPRHLPPVTHRVSHDDHQQYPGTQVKEARKIADLENQRDSLQSQLKDTEAKVLAIQKIADLVTSQRDALETQLSEADERAQLAETNANLAASQRDAMEAELKKKEEEEAQGKKAQLNQHGSDLAELPDNAPDTQFQEIRKDAQPAREAAEFAQTQPPNPGYNEKPAPLTQTLDSSVQPTDPSRD